MIVPGGGFSLDGQSWVRCRANFFVYVGVLSALFKRLMLDALNAAHKAGRLQFFGDEAGLADRRVFAAYLAPLRDIKWTVYAKPPFSGPGTVLAYLSRYTHRVAIANSRLIAHDHTGVSFRYKDYRAAKANGGRVRHKTMTLVAPEFIRRFLLHVLPDRFHRIRHGACPGLDPGDCWPMAGAPKTSPGPVSCSMCRRHAKSRTPSPIPQSHQIPPSPVRTAAEP